MTSPLSAARAADGLPWPPMRIAVARNEQDPYAFGFERYACAPDEPRTEATPLHTGRPTDSLVTSELGGPFACARSSIPARHGDYTLVDPRDGSLLLSAVTIERKGADLIGSLTHDRERVMLEMATIGAASACPVLLVESPIQDLVRGVRAGSAAPKSLIGTVLSILSDHRVMPLFLPSRSWAEYAAAWILRRRWRRWLHEDGARLAEVRRMAECARAQRGEAVRA